VKIRIIIKDMKEKWKENGEGKSGGKGRVKENRRNGCCSILDCRGGSRNPRICPQSNGYCTPMGWAVVTSTPDCMLRVSTRRRLEWIDVLSDEQLEQDIKTEGKSEHTPHRHNPGTESLF